MIKKRIYAKQNETGYTVYIEYSLFGLVFYVKEKHVESIHIDYSNF